MLDAELNQPWFYWSLVIAVALPLLVVVLGELAQRLKDSAHADYVGPLRFLRLFCLPILFLVLFLRMVVGYDGDALVVKAVDTTFWILIANLGLAILNISLFKSDDGIAAKTPKLLLDLLRFLMVMLATAVIVSTIWGVDFGRMLAALGVGSLVIGLALQDTLGSLFAGLAMMSSGQRKVGDWIEVGDVRNSIVTLNWRTVTIKRFGGDHVVIPNSMLSKDKLTIIGGDTPYRRNRINVWFAYDHPPDEVLAILKDTALRTDGVLKKPGPVASMSGYEETGIKYTVMYSVTPKGRSIGVGNQLRANVWYAAQRHGLTFPAQHHMFYRIPDDARQNLAPSAEQLAEQVAEIGAIPRPASALVELMGTAQWQRYRKGEVLLSRGEPMSSVFILLSGSIDAHYEADGESSVVASFHGGQVIALKTIFRGLDSQVNLVASKDVVLAAIPVSVFKAYLDNDLALAEEMEDLIEALDATIRRQNPDQWEQSGSDREARAKMFEQMFKYD